MAIKTMLDYLKNFAGSLFTLIVPILPDYVLIGLGLVPGHTTFRKFGKNNAIAAGTYTDLVPWNVDVVLETTEVLLTVVSDDVTDDVGDVGALSVTIEGVGLDYSFVTDTVAMDGTTPVNTTEKFRQVNRAYVASAGTDQTNAGNITIKHGTNIVGRIDAEYGQTQQAFFTVPLGMTLIVKHWWVSAGSGKVITGHLSSFDPVANTWLVKSEINVGGDTIPVPLDGDVTVAATQTVKLEGELDSAPVVDCSGEFSGILIDNTIAGLA